MVNAGDVVIGISTSGNSKNVIKAIRAAKQRNAVTIAGPFPLSVSVVRSNLVYVAKEGLPPAMLSRLWRLAAFQNIEVATESKSYYDDYFGWSDPRWFDESGRDLRRG